MRTSPLNRCVLSAAVALASSASLRAQEAEVAQPIVVDQEMFNHNFSFGGPEETRQTFNRGIADAELRLREVAADKSVSADQIDRIRMAHYSEKAKAARVRIDARRVVVGKEFPDAGVAFSTYNGFVSSQTPNVWGRQRPTVAAVVYDRVLTDQQKKNHLVFRAERRDRLARASILHQVSLLSQMTPMTVEQEIALAKLINREMPPAGLYDDAYISSIITFALSMVPPEELEAIFDEVQLAALKPHAESGVWMREELRRQGILDRITAYRAAVEKAAAAQEPAKK